MVGKHAQGGVTAQRHNLDCLRFWGEFLDQNVRTG
jgi:hypothetical protein